MSVYGVVIGIKCLHRAVRVKTMYYRGCANTDYTARRPTSIIDIIDYVTGIGNGARALHKLRIQISMFYPCCACCALSWAQQAETGSFYKLMVVIWTKI